VSSDRRVLRLVGSAVLGALSLIVLACNLTGALSRAASSSNPTPQATATIQSVAPLTVSKVSQTPGGPSLSSLPWDIPLYPGVTGSPGEGYKALTTFVVGYTPDSTAQVAAFYSAEMPDRGWTLTKTTPLPDGRTQLWAKGARTALITLQIAGQETQLGILFATGQG